MYQIYIYRFILFLLFIVCIKYICYESNYFLLSSINLKGITNIESKPYSSNNDQQLNVTIHTNITKIINEKKQIAKEKSMQQHQIINKINVNKKKQNYKYDFNNITYQNKNPNINKNELLKNLKSQNFNMFWTNFFNMKYDEQAFLLNYLYPVRNEYHKTLKETYKYRETYFRWEINTKAYSLHKQYNSFPDESYYWVYDNYDNIDKDNVIFGTYYIQHKIWEHQFPQTCDDKKFLIVPFWLAGIGSIVHVVTNYLTIAMDSDRIYIPAKDSQNTWVDDDFCDDKTFMCYFKSLTNCTISDDIHNMFRHPDKNLTDECAYISGFDNVAKNANKKYVYLSITKPRELQRISTPPHFVIDFFHEMHLIMEQLLFYWRIQGVAFFMRFNDKTKLALKQFQHESCPNCQNKYKISTYVRHGDKYSEMKLVDDERYAQLILVLQKFLNVNGTKPVTFINGDDQKSIKNVENNISVIYMNNTQRDNVNFGRLKQLKNTAIESFVNLKELIKAENSIITIESNWNRLLYELQQTVAFNSNGYTLEAGFRPCISVNHCHFIHKNIHFNW